MRKPLFLVINVWFWPVFVLTGQSNYPKGYFASPINAEITLSGNFGEIRPHHFHSGIDIRTGGKEGLPVYAVADGIVSRINISPYGYGKALYIDHPNGYTSVYAHLQSYNSLIDSLAKDYQYQRESFELDTLLSPFIRVKKGQFIGYSGNSGGSYGPHLHFEIRDTKTEEPINPLFFGYQVKDDVAPKVLSLNVYPLSKEAQINGRHEIKKMEAVEGKEYYHLDLTDSIVVYGEVGFGIDCYDTETGSTNKNAVYSIELQSGGRRLYYVDFERFSFDKTRYVNAHIDYAAKENNNVKIQKCFVSKNNQLGIYKELKDNGVVNFSDEAIHWMRVIVKDFYGNTSLLVFKVKATGVRAEEEELVVNNPLGSMLNCYKDNSCDYEGLRVKIPAYALYEDLPFTVSSSPQQSGFFSPVYHIHTAETPLQKHYEISIKTEELPAALQNKAVIVSLNKKGKMYSEGGEYSDGSVASKIRSFGDFSVSIDTVKPVIKPMFKNKKELVHFEKVKEIKIKAWDTLSGIGFYRATVDGKWVLLEYDAKNNLFVYVFDQQVKPGEHVFKLVLKDKKDNVSELEFEFMR